MTETTADVPAPPSSFTQLATASLQRLTGRAEASFRPGQLEAVAALLEGQRVLVVQRTGWGKSAVYFVTTDLLRRSGAGPTLIVSPLLALMRDQIAAAERAGIRAVTINSGNAHEWDAVGVALHEDAVDVVLISPERLTNPVFREEYLPSLSARCGLVVVDEAHCISDWGHDFRPDYRRVKDVLLTLPSGTPVLATTATANARVVEDVEQQLRPPQGEVATFRGSLARTSLRLGCLPTWDFQHRLAWLHAHLAELPGSGIIYTLTVAAAEDTAAALRAAGFAVEAYTGGMDADTRAALETDLRENQVKALVATSALGMGFDKPDLGFVVHLGAPSSPVAYYQHIGRAGRAVETADVLLLPGPEDPDIWHYFATASMPDPEQATAVLTALAEASGPLSTIALESQVNVTRSRLELLLKVLDVDGAVTRERGGWRATGHPWHYDAERYRRVAAARDAEATHMRDYLTTQQCRMVFLQTTLDDPHPSPCGRCDVCAEPWYPTDLPSHAVESVAGIAALTGVDVPARKQWPSGLRSVGIPLSGRIDGAERPAEGRAVARLTDLGWGPRLRQVLRDAEAAAAGSTVTSAAPLEASGAPEFTLPDPIVDALIRTLKDWPWQERPTGVVGIPSSTRPGLVQALCERVCALGRLPFLGTLVDQRPRGVPGVLDRPGSNSAFRLAEVFDRYALSLEMGQAVALHHGPILLIDDLISTGWTMTVASRVLRQAGAQQVLPCALVKER